MLADVCAYIHNYFLKKENGRVVYYQRTYTISGGMLSIDFMKEGQRFLLAGSDLNDGVYTYHANGIMNDDENDSAYLQDEVFCGTICPMAVPKELIDICGEISEWNEKYADKVNGPYQSESFNGYSYTLKTGAGSGDSSSSPSWQSTFGSRLKQWRKVSR